MKNVLRTMFGKSYLGKAFRLAVVAAFMVYVFVVIIASPSLNVYAESVRLKEIERLANGAEIEAPVDFNDYGDNYLSEKEKDNPLGLDSENAKSWDNEYDHLGDVKYEATEKRTASEKHFRMSDGSYSLLSFASDVHYLNNDKYEEIDNTLVLKDGVYRNKANALQVEFPEVYTVGAGKRVIVNGYDVVFKLVGQVGEPKAEVINETAKYKVTSKNGYSFYLNTESQIQYTFDNFVLQQQLTSTSLKENIIIENANFRGITYAVETKLELSLRDDGNIAALSPDGKSVFTIPTGYMFDSRGKKSNDVSYSLSQTKQGKYSFTVSAKDSWLKSTERSFPIVIDPTITITTNDTTFRSASRASTTLGSTLTTTSANKSFMDFDIPSSIRGGDITILAAVLNAYIYRAGSSNIVLSVWAGDKSFDAGDAPTNESRQIKDPATGQTSTRYSHYYDDPNRTYTAEQKLNITNTSTSPSSGTGRYGIDITRLIKRAVDFGYESDFHGVVFSSPSSTNVYIYCEAASSSYRPYLEVAYRNNVGLESYWDYDQYAVGNASIYINKYNDAMTIVHDDVSIASDLPISVQHIYMSAYTYSNYNPGNVYTSANYGLGWKLNYQQVVISRSSTSYEYYDADGTSHYFYKNGSIFQDEDGLGLKIEPQSNSQLKMTDMNLTQRWFDSSGRLFKIQDKYGNITNIVISNGRITQVNDNNNRSVNFVYNSSGYLTTLNYMRADGQTAATTTISYSSNRIYYITNDDGTYTYFYFSSGNLREITDQDGYGFEFVSDQTFAAEVGLNIPPSTLSMPFVKTRTVYEISSDGWRHVADNIYCNGLTVTASALPGKAYVPFEPFSTYQSMANTKHIAYRNQLMADSGWSGSWTLFLVFTLGLGLFIDLILLTAAAMDTIEPYSQMCLPFYEQNLRLKSVYDRAGRLVSQYIDNKQSATSKDIRYEQQTSNGVSVNNNKTKATASYTPGINNLIKDGSFENGITGFPSGTTSVSTSTAYASHGNQSMQMYAASVSSSTSYIERYTSVTVSAGTYTLSADIKVVNLSPYSSSTTDYGAFVRFYNYANSEKVSSNVYTTNNGFRHVSVTYTFTSQTSVSIDMVMLGCSGYAYFDAVQVVRNDYGTIENFNMVDNAGFEDWTSTAPAGWGFSGSGTISKITGKDAFSGNSAKLVGTDSNYTVLSRSVPIAAPSLSTAYTFSVWVNTLGRIYNTTSASNTYLYCRLTNSSGSSISYVEVPISSTFAIWQQVSVTVIATSATRNINIGICVDYTPSTLYVDNVSIVKSEVINLDYNSTTGKNTSYDNGQNNYTYSESGTSASLYENNSLEYNLTKDSYGNVLTNMDTKRNIKVQYTYGNSGRVTSETISSTASGSKSIASSTSYQYLSNNLIESLTETDSLGFKTISNYYTYSGLLNSTTFNSDTFVEYSYSNGTPSSTFPDRVSKITITTKTAANGGSVLSTEVYEYLTLSDSSQSSGTYGYRHVGALKSVTMGNGTVYSYKYDAWGNVVEVKLNGIVQITNEYRYQDGAPLKKILANGYTEHYAYNSLGRLSEFRATTTNVSNAFSLSTSSLAEHVYYEYTLSGKLVSVKDIKQGKGYWFLYDTNGRLYLNGEGTASSAVGPVSTQIMFETVYDSYGDIATKNIIEGGTKRTSSFDYDSGRPDGRIAGQTLENGNYVRYTYDALGRVTDSEIITSKSNSTQLLKENYTYLDSNGGGATGKNLFPDNAWIQNGSASYTYTNNVLTVTSLTASDRSYVRVDITSLTSGALYTLSFNNLIANSSGYVDLHQYGGSLFTYVSTAATGSPALTFSAPSGGISVYIYAAYSSYAIGRQTSISNIQLESGSVATSWVPYSQSSGGNSSNTSYTVSGLNITRNGSSTLVNYNYVYNMDNSLLAGVREKKANPYDIYQIKEGSTVKAEYFYDELGKLIRENDAYNNKTVIYTYDANNNITSKKTYSYYTGNSTPSGSPTTINYTYDSTQKDRLITFNGQSITYDGFGNPLSYLGKTLTWSGRNLSTLTTSGTTYTYKYNPNGLRYSKSGASVTTTYYFNGSILVGERNGTDTLWYMYNQSGMVGFELNGTAYYYVRNLQGDVMQIINSSGITYATYTYSAWGYCTVGTNLSNVATKNPIRYRGYYYDNESGLYYLNSRYYDPNTGRMLSPDVVAEGGNLYAYCQNDPVNRADENGYFSIKKMFKATNLAIIGVVAIATAVSVLSCGAAAPVMAAAVVTLAAGVLTTTFAAAEMHEAITNNNFLKDGVFNGNQKAYDMTMLVSSVTAQVGTMIIAPYAGKCFVAGTAVMTENGAIAIENIEVGMLVYAAYDDAVGEVALKPVVRLFRNETYELTKVKTSDGQEIVSTPGHPYYVPNRGWVNARDLRAGDLLLRLNGRYVVIELVQHEILEAPVTVYNFEVADYHTYFVAENANVAVDDFILVHNACGQEVHHVVERNQAKNSGFSKAQINDKSNLVTLDKATHKNISSYYSSKQSFTNGQTVRVWLRGQSFAEQTKFGWSVIAMFL